MLLGCSFAHELLPSPSYLQKVEIQKFVAFNFSTFICSACSALDHIAPIDVSCLNFL